MGLFETIRDIEFSESVANSLASIATELKKNNILRKRELDLKSQQIKLKENSTDSKYKNAYDLACERLAELDKLLCSYDGIKFPTSSSDYKKIFLESSVNTYDNKLISADIAEISEKEFDEFISALAYGINDKKYYESIQQKFGNSFMYYSLKENAYVCYDYIGGDCGMPNVETIKEYKYAKEWLLGNIEIDEINDIYSEKEIEIEF